MSTALQADPDVHRDRTPATAARVVADGKFLRAGDERFLVKGVTYGTFAPDRDGYQFPPIAQVSEDFRLMASLGLNTVRTYTPPRLDLLDEAARHGLRVMVGMPWSQHVAFLDDRRLRQNIRRDIAEQVRELGSHPAVLMCALGNEIPPGVVRWHGRVGVERFLRHLYQDARSAAPDTLLTYVNFPPTEFLDLSFFDVCAFNVYLHREPELRAYLARLQNIAGHKPLLLAEAGADSIREGETGQAEITAMHVRASFEEGACGAIAFAWTDEWWRGGHPVQDWAFGLVDRARHPKPAARAVAQAFADAPFAASVRATWPRVSVVVCAYNAADTIEDNLQSLEKLTYPDYEIILVNDGSRDATAAIARRHGRVRVIDIPNGGLSAARNVGLSEATGEIVAYTDADTRVDPDWLTFLVQPFLRSDAVGSGGPNVVPPDDPPIAQCIARAPGGPTHVLLDDRTAEHVPGCNMAFRREALVAIGGFNPIYLRAGDDVDVCWRLQARGWKIGFAPAALVWHHHRASIAAYWRQQVGYGEGETWLMAHHPEKFLDGRMLWRGRIYSPLPFVRSLWGTKINAGVWGTAAFPSVYRTDVHPFAFLPHSIRFQVLSFVLTLLGAGVAATRAHHWAAYLLLATGMFGLAFTIEKNLAYAMRSEVGSLTGSKLWYRLTVAYLHFIQPLARIRGRVRGALTPPEVALPAAAPQTSHGPRPTLSEAWRAVMFLTGTVTEDRFWSEHWTSADRILAALTEWLRRSHAVRVVAIDEGWSDDRDVSVPVGRWAWLDVRALVEDHGGGKSLLRVSTHLRPTTFGVVSAVAVGAALFAVAVYGFEASLQLYHRIAPNGRMLQAIDSWKWAGRIIATATLAAILLGIWATSKAAAVLRRGLCKVTEDLGMVEMPSGPARAPLIAPSLVRRYGLRSAMVFVGMVVALGAGAGLLREARTDVQIIVGEKDGESGPVISTWLETPGGMTIDRNGDIYIADSNNDVIVHADPSRINNRPVAVAGIQGRAGFSGDDGPALKALLDTPDGVCIAPDGDLVVADSRNDRIRRIDKPTRVITTIAGSGENGYDGDEKTATAAALNTPSAVACAPNGDIYIADMLNYRVRVLEARTGLIHTVAGDGTPGDINNIGDGGPAPAARLNMPADVQIAPNGDIYIADWHHNRIRKVDAKTRVISTVAGSGTFGPGGDDGPATQANLAGPTGIALVPEPEDQITIFIADFYNGQVRAVGPDGIMRNVSDEGRVAFGAPSRVAFALGPKKPGWLYVSDANSNNIVAVNIPRTLSGPILVPRALPAAAPAPKRGGE